MQFCTNNCYFFQYLQNINNVNCRKIYYVLDSNIGYLTEYVQGNLLLSSSKNTNL